MKITYPLLAVLALTVISCDNPAKIASNMDKTTTNMSRTTNAMSDHVSNTDTNSARLGITAKKGQGAQFRDQFFKSMLETKDFTAKTDMAAEYMYALEFQVWEDSGIDEIDSYALLEDAKAEAVLETAKKMSQFLNKKTRKELTGLEKSEDMENFYAMAGVLHKTNSLQKAYRKGTGLKVESLMDIIADGLLQRVELEKGNITAEDLTAAQREVLKEEQLFTTIVDGRYKFIPLILLSRISYIKDGILDEVKMLFRRWSPVYSNAKKPIHLNAAQLEYLSVFANETIKAKKLLNTLGKTSSIDKKVLKIYSNMDMTIAEDGPVVLTEEEKVKIANFQAKLVELFSL